MILLGYMKFSIHEYTFPFFLCFVSNWTPRSRKSRILIFSESVMSWKVFWFENVLFKLSIILELHRECAGWPFHVFYVMIKIINTGLIYFLVFYGGTCIDFRWIWNFLTIKTLDALYSIIWCVSIAQVLLNLWMQSTNIFIASPRKSETL